MLACPRLGLTSPLLGQTETTTVSVWYISLIPDKDVLRSDGFLPLLWHVGVCLQILYKVTKYRTGQGKDGTFTNWSSPLHVSFTVQHSFKWPCIQLPSRLSKSPNLISAWQQPKIAGPPRRSLKHSNVSKQSGELGAQFCALLASIGWIVYPVQIKLVTSVLPLLCSFCF